MDHLTSELFDVSKNERLGGLALEPGAIATLGWYEIEVQPPLAVKAGS